jgi:hypothetical protein
VKADSIRWSPSRSPVSRPMRTRVRLGRDSGAACGCIHAGWSGRHNRREAAGLLDDGRPVRASFISSSAMVGLNGSGFLTRDSPAGAFKYFLIAACPDPFAAGAADFAPLARHRARAIESTLAMAAVPFPRAMALHGRALPSVFRSALTSLLPYLYPPMNTALRGPRSMGNA